LALAALGATALSLTGVLVEVQQSVAAGVARTFSYHSIASVPIGTNEAQSVVVGDKLYLFGGFDTLKQTFTPTDRGWSYNATTNTWTALPTMPVRGITHAGIATDGTGTIFYAGGSPSDASGTGQVFGTTDAFRFDIASGTYTRLPSLPVARMAGGLAYVSGRLYYLGGNDLTRTHDSGDVWMLDVAAGATSWVSRAPMPDPRNHLGWGVIDGKVYAVGGQHLDQSWTAQGELDRYDPATDSWTTLAPLPTARGHLMDSTFVLDGHLVAAGGWTTGQVSSAVEAYDTASNSWAEWTPLPEARTSTTVKALSGGRIVFCCGSAGTSNATAWIAVPTGPSQSPTAAPTTSVAAPTSAPTTSVAAPTSAPTTSDAAPTSTSAAAPRPPPPAQPTLPPTLHPVPVPSPSSRPPLLPVAALSAAVLHPATVASTRAGKVQLSFRLSRTSKVAFVLERCQGRRCSVVARLTAGAPRGRSHISVHAISRRSTLPAGHYRLVVTPARGRPVAVGLAVHR
jgi:N-acetylneuraminic acid mutarotase